MDVIIFGFSVWWIGVNCCSCMIYGNVFFWNIGMNKYLYYYNIFWVLIVFYNKFGFGDVWFNGIVNMFYKVYGLYCLLLW